MTMTTALLRGSSIIISSHNSSNTGRFLLKNIVQRSFFSTWNWKESSSSDEKTKKELYSKEGSPLTTTSVDPTLQTEVLEKCSELHGNIMPLNDRVRGPLAHNSHQGTALPLVFLVGNHSSGKSSFINYVMGREIQVAGVAPTDDTFTVILPGPEDTDQDGPALVGDPDLGFSGLRQFGPTLIHHTQLKVRKGIRNSNFMFVDSPGMIDSPQQVATMDRGYDFQNVVKWFAERADVVLLFFDPDKPGTTGETLNILLHSLGGMDHKLLIILNKADQFKKIHDFARAYGSLCWNLSKVIPRKDLPRIFTMCLPTSHNTTATETTLPPPAGLADLHQTRNDVVAEVMKAPKRRIDNVITHLSDSVHQLQLHAILQNHVRQRYRKHLWNHRMQVGVSSVMASALISAAVYTDIPLHFLGATVSASTFGVGGLFWYNSLQLEAIERSLITTEELSSIFQREFSREVINDADEYVASVWQRIRRPLQLSLETIGLQQLPHVSTGELQQLRNILEKEIPELRRLASPTHYGKR